MQCQKKDTQSHDLEPELETSEGYNVKLISSVGTEIFSSFLNVLQIDTPGYINTPGFGNNRIQYYKKFSNRWVVCFSNSIVYLEPFSVQLEQELQR